MIVEFIPDAEAPFARKDYEEFHRKMREMKKSDISEHDDLGAFIDHEISALNRAFYASQNEKDKEISGPWMGIPNSVVKMCTPSDIYAENMLKAKNEEEKDSR